MTAQVTDPLRELLPCPFCGSDDIGLWDGFGTQADIGCKECCCERNVQAVDLFEIDERPTFDETTFRYPEPAIDRVNAHLIAEWNTRAALSAPQAAQWRDIATAPKDGTTISVWHRVWKCPISVRYIVSNAPCKWVEATLTTQWPDDAFTHWQPLPSPPVSVDGGQS